MSKTKLVVRHPLALAVAIVGSLSTPTFAEELALEEVTVTAQKREQNALEVPVTVDTFSSADMENTNALKLSDMADYVPGFEAGSSVTQSGLRIRGIESPSISAGGDPSVAVFYDDAYVPSPATSMSFADMQRVEILKGPQGTLFGRNAAAGTVNMVPNRPEAEFDAFVSARLGNYGLQQFEGMVNAPVTDNVFLRGNLMSYRRDGYVDNIFPGGVDSGSEDILTGRVSAWWDISDKTSAQLSYDWDEVDNAPRQAIGVSPYSYSLDPFAGKVENDVMGGEETRSMSAVNAKLMHSFSDAWSLKWVSSYRQWETSNREEEDGTADISRYLDTNNIFDSDISYHELQINFTGDKVTAVMGANYSRENIYQSTDVTSTASAVTRLVTGDIVNNPELRAQIAGGAALSVGGFPGDGGIGDMAAGQALAALDSVDHLWEPDDWATFTSLIAPAMGLAGPLPQVDDYYDAIAYNVLGTGMLFGPSFAGQHWNERVENEGDFTNWGLYFDMDYALTDKINVLAGLRYSTDEKSFSWLTPGTNFHRIRPGVEEVIFSTADDYNVGQGVREAREEWSATTGRLVGQYHFSESAMAFLSYSTGYKSGGFDSLNLLTADTPIEPEEVDNIELGVKGDLLDNLRLQVSYFDMTVDNRQRSVESKPPGSANALPRVINGDQQFNGIEVTVDWLPLDTLRLGLVTTVRDEESKWNPFYDAEGELQNEREKSSVNTAYTLAMDWAPAIPLGSINVHMDYIYAENTDELEPGYLASFSAIDGVGEDDKRLNGRIAWQSGGGNYELALWGRNLLDNERAAIPSGRTLDVFGTPYTSISEPRSYGAEVRYNF
ncbi:TonB-dependent Receptor Plug Domain [Microbulbifer donghaiensis]|uniref:TonB-dependent Receptor Plug Domain n=1 Tax=Microbulbifer donghaiensis TaxID=494016 RepID=A0A1M4ZSU4_9GAMM|nr:TonB-dependent receptor [Microbulbifer donghaiensis]SHF21078.1 TonB-dependent Receptor Plug Domain [Microbulbifer donghaiensis]